MSSQYQRVSLNVCSGVSVLYVAGYRCARASCWYDVSAGVISVAIMAVTILSLPGRGRTPALRATYPITRM